MMESGITIWLPGYQHPEGIVVYNAASRQLSKRTFANDGGKWRAS